MKKAREEKWSVWGLEGGLITFIENLHQKLLDLGIEIQFDQNILDQDLIQGSDFTFWSTPAYVTSKAMLNLDLSETLASIPFVDVALMNYVFQGKNPDLIKNPGFGFLVPSSESHVPILGVIYDTCSFPQGDYQIYLQCSDLCRVFIHW